MVEPDSAEPIWKPAQRVEDLPAVFPERRETLAGSSTWAV